MIRPRLPSLLLAFSLAGCGGSTSATDDGANPDPRYQPVAQPNSFLPFPSSFYTKADATTETKLRVSIPKGVLPKNQVGAEFDPARWNLLDGWSPATQLVADLGGPVDGAKLPGQSDLASSVLPTSAVQLLAYDTGERVPLFAEMDANPTLMVGDSPVDARKVLLAHPMVRLRPNTRYVVALVGLVDPNGKAIAVKPFQSLVSGTVASGSRLGEVKARYDEIFAFLDKQGVPRASLTMAWDFTTASDKQATGHLLAMRDAAFKRWQMQNLGWQNLKVDNNPGGDWLMRITGTFQVPSFLTSNTDGKAGLSFDAANNPVDTGTNFDAKLLINVPKCVTTATLPVPVMIYGHGLFGAADEANGGVHQATANALCMVYAATDWVGLADTDANYVVATVFSNFDKFYIPTDRLQQGQLNFMTLARLALKKFPMMAELHLADPRGAMQPITDGAHVYYDGNSQGGIEGNTLMALSPDIQRGVLGVPGGIYSLMLTRSTDFKSFKAIMDQTYPSQYDQEVMLALAQSLWDFSDPISFVGHTLKDPFNDDAGNPMKDKHILMQVGVGDGQVPNVSAETIARTAGLQMLSPGVKTIYGLPMAAAPLDSAYTLWEVHANPLPDGTNVPPAHDNCTHEAVRRIPEAIEQKRRFLRPGGKVEQTCMGTCDFHPADCK